MEQATASKNEAILELLRTSGPMSAYQVARALELNGTGQALTRLRTLEIRGRVKQIEHPARVGWHLWQLVQ